MSDQMLLTYTPAPCGHYCLSVDPLQLLICCYPAVELPLRSIGSQFSVVASILCIACFLGFTSGRGFDPAGGAPAFTADHLHSMKTSEPRDQQGYTDPSIYTPDPSSVERAHGSSAAHSPFFW
ncbi:hypothetical protein F511_13549 [Dorcoceras hygrometricum]|uniref:Uncharacterized protein n=1 Tax=Dorcoceras hygrometricum TaxID=472368 RepID=A0A2Z7APH9_9LAMI|nr:hypothetical protein F511_13549 [Dorcoceras hygrometricum]